jgi:hypothetical protein
MIEVLCCVTETGMSGSALSIIPEAALLGIGFFSLHGDFVWVQGSRRRKK